MDDYLSLIIPSDVLNALQAGVDDHDVIDLIKNRIETEYGDQSFEKALELIHFYKNLLNEKST